MGSIVFETKEQIVVITLNRPEKFNAVNREMALQLQAALEQCKGNDCRAVLITGAGKAFCAGQDLEEAIDPQGPGMERILKEHYNPLITQIRALQKPVVAAVNGVAAGAGANLALSCDLCIASDNASFIQAFSKIGLVPDSGGSFFLPRLVGWQRAAGLMMLGEKITSAEALQMGLIWKTVVAAQLQEEAMTLVKQLATMPTRALALIKEQLNQSATHNLAEQLALEDQLQLQAAATDDFKEGVAAFLEKRKPVFKGH
ncbi:MAG: 2-(1,2-epoxy-1,2-dihydrophenyl)acetyl-CoA isomerase [Bacteroidetes bacterium]|nr:2-(1,2-epoxy-1,2-dihydrophenyl)acetyl-CoA isomerase [Bacteroidota bacterium]